jgi:ketosteroid isomerase-like protein
MTTTTTFDVDALRDAIESADAEGQLRHYADDAEVTIVDRDNPPSKPIKLRGHDEIRGYLEDIAGRDMTHSVGFAVADERAGGYSLNCRYPSGQRVSCAALFELDGGRIVRMEGVQGWDD